MPPKTVMLTVLNVPTIPMDFVRPLAPEKDQDPSWWRKTIFLVSGEALDAHHPLWMHYAKCISASTCDNVEERECGI